MSLDVSLVVVSYDMEAQLRRTLTSLAPPYQKELAPGTAEAIVVDNGSPQPPRLEGCADGALKIRLVRYPDPNPSPVGAVNHGLSLAEAPAVGVLIDGARMASPGLVAGSLAALARHPRAIVATYNRHLGPKLQHRSMREGYDAAAEARLLSRIGWPADGYRLFEISTAEGGDRWPDPMFETNALFMRREMWDELGGYDAGFTSEGGGGVNADTLRRACSLPQAQLIVVDGEATFHQIHGGVMTNRRDDRPVKEAAVEFVRLRGGPTMRLKRPGWLYEPATGRLLKDPAERPA